MPRPLTFPGVFYLAPLLFSPSMLAQSPWTKVPALPQACYRTQDTFERDVEKAKAELEAAIEKQEQINRSLVDQVFKMDPATLSQRMMAAGPARAQEIMQAMASMGADAQGAATAAEAEEEEFKFRKEKLAEDFMVETRALGPIDATSAASYAQYNRKYETVLCPKWFGKEIPELLASYRAYLDKRIPKRAEAQMSTTRMFELFQVPAKEFRPVAELQGVVDYLRFASDLYLHRTVKPLGAGS